MRVLLALAAVSPLFSAQEMLPARFRMAAAEADSTVAGLQSNVVVDIRAQGDSLVLLGTGRGLAVIRDSVTTETFVSTPDLEDGALSTMLPEGGVSAMAIGGDTVLVAVAGDTVIVGESLPKGQGLGLSVNFGDTVGTQWLYIAQPRDGTGDSLFLWYGDTVRALPIPLEIGNVTYDAAIGSDYYWIASFYGGVRRLHRWSPGTAWERVPLPADTAGTLDCGALPSGYRMDPNAEDNHRAFSVMAHGDTVWVGTGNGVNRGVVASDGCIGWTHYSFPDYGLSGNWVLALARQVTAGDTILWATTLRTDEGSSGVSYTDDDGDTWWSVSALEEEWGWNLFAMEDFLYVASKSGLWRSGDGRNFARYLSAVDSLGDDEILDDDVYAVLHDERPGVAEALWIGTGDGVARSSDPGSGNASWEIERVNAEPEADYAYPNPFSPFLDNVRGGDGYARFHLAARDSGDTALREIRLTIYNFAMERVREIVFQEGNGAGALKWDGRDASGNHVANGPYFCSLFYDDAHHWVKLVVVK